MTQHIKGYANPTEAKVTEVNVNKELEERVLRRIEQLGLAEGVDPRMLALGKTGIQEAFMWINRAVFQPGRVRLPEDAI